MNGLTVACVLAAWTVTALAVAGVLASRGMRAGSGRAHLICEAHQRAEAARDADERELLYAHLDAYAATVTDYYDTTTGGTQ